MNAQLRRCSATAAIGMIALGLAVVGLSPPSEAVVLVRFTTTVAPAVRTVTAGDPTAYEVRLVGSRLPATFQLSASGLPAGVSADFLSTGSKTRRVMLLRTSTTTPSGSHPIVVAVRYGSTTKRATVSLKIVGTVLTRAPLESPTTTPLVTITQPTPTTVPPTTAPTPPATLPPTTAPPTTIAPTTTLAPGLTLTASPAVASVTAGQSASIDVTPNPLGVNVTYLATGLPPGTTVNLVPNPSFGRMTMVFTTSTSTPAGLYSITVTGVTATLAKVITVGLEVKPFGLTASPSFQTVAPGGTASYAIAVVGPATLVNPTFGIAGLPLGTTAVFTPVPGANAAKLTIATTASTPLATYAMTVTATATGINVSVPIQLIVSSATNPSFGLAVTPSALSVARGSDAVFGVTITPQGGFSGPISITVLDLPSGSTATFIPLTADANSITGRLTISVASAAPLGTSTVRVLATGGGLSATVSVSLSVV